MQLKLYSVKDTKVGAFDPPQPARTHGEAERTLQTMVNQPNTKLNLYPEDHELWYVADYDSLTGTIKPLDSIQHIVNAVSLKQKPN